MANDLLLVRGYMPAEELEPWLSIDLLSCLLGSRYKLSSGQAVMTLTADDAMGVVQSEDSDELIGEVFLTSWHKNEDVDGTFTGGELNFLDLTDDYGMLAVMPRVGDLLIYPASHRRVISKVTTGQRVWLSWRMRREV